MSLDGHIRQTRLVEAHVYDLRATHTSPRGRAEAIIVSVELRADPDGVIATRGEMELLIPWAVLKAALSLADDEHA